MKVEETDTDDIADVRFYYEVLIDDTFKVTKVTNMISRLCGHQLIVPRHRLSTYGRCAFAVASPMAFKAMPDHLRDPSVNTATFARSLKLTCSLLTSTLSALEVF